MHHSLEESRTQPPRQFQAPSMAGGELGQSAAVQLRWAAQHIEVCRNLEAGSIHLPKSLGLRSVQQLADECVLLACARVLCRTTPNPADRTACMLVGYRCRSHPCNLRHIRQRQSDLVAVVLTCSHSSWLMAQLLFNETWVMEHSKRSACYYYVIKWGDTIVPAPAEIGQQHLLRSTFSMSAN